MAAINSPAKILKLWRKVNDRFGVDDEDKELKKKASEKDKAAAKQNEKITKGLTVLRTVAKGGVKKPSQVKKFESTREKVLRVMKKYCKAIKSAKLEGAKDMVKLRKSVKQLTIVVGDLNPLQIVEDEQGDVDLNVIAAVDTTQLDKALEDPNFAAGTDDEDVDFTEAETEEEENEGVPTPPEAPPIKAPDKATPPKAPPPPSPGVMQRLNALTPHYTKAVALKGDDTARMQTLFAAIAGMVKNKDLAQAGRVLDELEPLVHKAIAAKPAGTIPPAPPPPGKTPPKAPPSPDQEALRFTERLKKLAPEVQKAKASGTKAGTEVNLLVSEANTFARKKDFAQANSILDRMETLLQQSRGTVPPAPPPPPGVAPEKDEEEAESDETDSEDAPKDLAAAKMLWKTTSENTLNKLRVLAKKVAGSKHTDATKAVLELNAVIKQVTKDPANMQQVVNLERWLKDDDIVADVCKFSFDARKPLLKALAGLKPFVPA